MTRFQVDSDTVFSVATATRGSIERLQSEAATLTSQLAALQDSWTGQAASAFQVVATEWRSAHAQLEQSMASINAALGHAGQGYADVEASNARLFGR